MALRAVVLAAGRGVRMGGGTPKTLIPLGDREPLLLYILEGLEAAGIDDLVVVTGHRPDEVVEHVRKWWSATATFVRNARYASWGNFHSVRIAIDGSPGADLLVVNSDVVVDPEIYRAVPASAGDLVLAVQRRPVLDDEDMRVHLDGDRVLGVSKELKRAFGHGEFCGVSLIRPPAARLYADIAGSLEWTGQTHAYYEDVYHRMARRVDARAVLVAPGAYAEVDDPRDVSAAVQVVDRVVRPGS